MESASRRRHYRTGRHSNYRRTAASAGRRGASRSSRRRSQPARRYSLAYLLSRQPKSLAKHADYPRLIERLESSERLRRVRFTRRCYSLLQHARIAPHNLPHFYRTYRLPDDSFFPLFFRIKSDYLAERERKREAHRRAIQESVRALPPTVLAFIKYLGRLEQHYNAAGRYPLWQEQLFPATKKQAHAYHGYTQQQWRRTFRAHLTLLEQRYRRHDRATSERLLSCFLLECLPAGVPPSWPSRAEVTRGYRKLSLRHHPDRGGEAETFVALKQARDLLHGADGAI